MSVNLSIYSQAPTIQVVDNVVTLQLASSQGPSGPTGATGAAGPNTVTAATTTTLTGILYGNAANVSTLPTQAQNAILAGPSSGGAGAATFRALVAADIPALSYDASGAAATAQAFAIQRGNHTGTQTIGTISGLGTGVATALGLAGNAAGGFAILDGSARLPAAQLPAFTGDITTSAGSTATTLAASGVVSGSYGGSSNVPVITFDGKGRATSASSATYLGSALGGTSLASGIVTSSLTTVGALSSGSAASGFTVADACLSSNVPLKNAANTFTLGPNTFQSGAAGNVGLTVKGAASQTADLLQVQNSSGNSLFGVYPNGASYFRAVGGTAGTNELQVSHSSLTSSLTVAPGGSSGQVMQIVCRDRTYKFQDGTGYGFYAGTTPLLGGGLAVTVSGYVQWSSSSAPENAADTKLTRASAGILNLQDPTTTGGTGVAGVTFSSQDSVSSQQLGSDTLSWATATTSSRLAKRVIAVNAYSGSQTALTITATSGSTPTISLAGPTTVSSTNGNYLKLPSMTVANLTSASTAGFGAIAAVSDSATTTGGQVATGGGTNSSYVKSDGSNWYTWDQSGLAPGLLQPYRLGLQSGVWTSSADQTNQSTLYANLGGVGASLALYSGSVWSQYSVSQINLALSGMTSGKNYDVFAYYAAGSSSTAAVRGTGATSGSTTGTITVTLPTNNAGDILLVGITNNGSALTTPSGWTARATGTDGSGSGFMAIFEMVSTGSVASVTISVSGTTQTLWRAAAYAISGASYEAAATVTSFGTANVAPAVTSGGTGRILFNFFGGLSGGTISAPGGETSVTIAGSATMTAGYQAITTAGSTGTFTATASTTQYLSGMSILYKGTTVTAGVYIDLGTAWTNDTTRALNLNLQDGVYVNATSFTGLVNSATVAIGAGRYLGSIRATGATTTTDSAVARFVWNANNQASRHLAVTDTTASWTYAVTTWRQARATAANQVDVLIGLQGPTVNLQAFGVASLGGTVNQSLSTGIGEDSTTVPDALCYGMNTQVLGGSGAAQFSAQLTKLPAIGHHYYAWLESGNTNTATFYGTDATPYRRVGLIGWLDC